MAKTFKIQQKRVFEAEEAKVEKKVPEFYAESESSKVIHILSVATSGDMTDAELDLFEDRAAIMEFDGGLDRRAAEECARSRGTPAELFMIMDFDCTEITGALYDSLPKFKDRDENGIKRISDRPGKKIIREVVAPWDRVSCA
jgi:hypothetical protein